VRASLGAWGDGGMDEVSFQVPPRASLPVGLGLATMKAPVSWCS